MISTLISAWAAGRAYRLATALSALTSRWSVPLLSLLLLRRVPLFAPRHV